MGLLDTCAGDYFSFVAIGRKPSGELREPVMKHGWIDEFSDEATSAWVAVRTLWIEDIWPILMTFGIFFVFAAPLIGVILILWYLDSIGWRPGPGFYTIGSAASAYAVTLLG